MRRSVFTAIALSAILLPMQNGLAQDTVKQDVLKPVRLRILNADGKAATSAAIALFDTEIVKDGPVDLIWTQKDGTVLTSAGEIAAEKISESLLQDVVNKWRTVAYVGGLEKASPLKVSIEPSALHYALDERVKFVSDPLEFTHVIAINLASTGEVQLLHPKRDSAQRIPKGTRYEMATTVTEPLGADHLMVIASERPLKGLPAKLKSATAADLPALLRDALVNMRYQIGIKGLFSAKSRPAL